MPIRKCANKKYRIGGGPCIYKTLKAAQQAYKAYLAKRKKKKGKPRLKGTAKEHFVKSRTTKRRK